jgi:hypothetical protein
VQGSLLHAQEATVAFPPSISTATLTTKYLQGVNGAPASGQVSIRAAQRNATDGALLTSDPVVVPIDADGTLSVTVPVGDDTDLRAPLVLEVQETISGQRKPPYRVQVTAADVVAGVVQLDKLTPIAGSLPVNAYGYVRTINGATPDPQGNLTLNVGDHIDLTGYVQDADLQVYAQKSELSPLATSVAPLLLVQAGAPDAMVVGAITRDANGAATGFAVTWPDGATGVYAGTASVDFPGSIDAYTITHVLAGVTTTFTQPAVTRDATTGAVTNRPAITVA